ncbi:MAG: Do family serine endopeptidase [Planctomycetes bacterium]|nr:Do family serine endopeptidase [Planctomycetota bacterium]
MSCVHPSAFRGLAVRSTPFCLACTVALAAAAGLLLAAPRSRAEDALASTQALVHANALSTAFRTAAEIATPSVVVVRSAVKAKPARDRRPGGQRGNPLEGTPFEHMFPDGLPEGLEFNGPEGWMPRRSGTGSGVIVAADGLVITNNHVVEGADEVVVELSDGREFKAAEIKTDPDSDLAVVRLKDARGLPVAKLGDSDKLSIGDWVIAIGNPFDLETTVSAGIISGKGRELGSIRRAQFLQTDAAINPGNSGGPLVNLSGEVIGINTAIASSSGGYQGIGFAIPVNLAKWVTGQLIDKGEVERAFIGVQMGPLDRRMAEKLGVGDREGVLVNDVVPDSPAAVAGVQPLDVITGFDGKPIDGPRALQEVVERSELGRPHSLTVLREGKPVTLKVNVKPLPGDLAQDLPRRESPQDASGATFYSKEFGIEVRDKAAVAEDVYPDHEGVLVDRVDADGLAAETGIGPGMLVRKVDRTPVKTIAEFAAAIERQTSDAGVMLQIRTPSGNSVRLLKKD